MGLRNERVFKKRSSPTILSGSVWNLFYSFFVSFRNFLCTRFLNFDLEKILCRKHRWFFHFFGVFWLCDFLSRKRKEKWKIWKVGHYPQTPVNKWYFFGGRVMIGYGRLPWHKDFFWSTSILLDVHNLFINFCLFNMQRAKRTTNSQMLKKTDTRW